MPEVEHQTTSRTIRTVTALADAGLLAGADPAGIGEVAARYAISITPTVRERIGTAANGPVGLQFVPSTDELRTTDDELADPIGDDTYTPIAGITHRYKDRVLLKPLHICPVYCRFCFRRETVGPAEGLLSEADLVGALDYIREHTEVWEVILTGGDPLLLSPARLGRIIRELDGIGHIGVIRIHTRVPVVAPERITPQLIDAMSADTAVWTVVHCNHRDELGTAAENAVRRLVDAGLPLLSQTVLLKGVNDTAAALEDLFRALVQLRIKPYYLHQSDLAPGTSHFRTSIAVGRALVRQLRGPVSGLCQPTYVLDIPGGHGKVPIAESYLIRDQDGYLVTAPNGEVHRYAPATATDGDVR